MKNYEIMFIVKTTLNDEEADKVAKDLENLLITNGAQMTNYKNYGKRELAYEINKNKSGYYYLFNFESDDNQAVNEFNRVALINKDIIRHLITKREE